MQKIPALLLTLAAAGPVAAQAPATAAKPAQLPADSMELGRKFTGWFYNNAADSLIAHMDAGAKGQPNLKSELQGQSAGLVQRAGFEDKVINEKFITRNGMRQYWRTAQFTNMTEPVVIRFVMTSKGEIAGWGMNPLSKVPPIDP